MQFFLTIPDDLYLRAQKVADLRQESMQSLLLAQLSDSVEQEEMNLPSVTALETGVEREKAAYRAMHAQLFSVYPGHHVAIYQGKLVDHDQDGVALSRRIYARYPNDFVLITQVEPQAERTLHFRSPRFISGEAAEVA